MGWVQSRSVPVLSSSGRNQSKKKEKRKKSEERWGAQGNKNINNIMSWSNDGWVDSRGLYHIHRTNASPFRAHFSLPFLPLSPTTVICSFCASYLFYRLSPRDGKDTLKALKVSPLFSWVFSGLTNKISPIIFFFFFLRIRASELAETETIHVQRKRKKTHAHTSKERSHIELPITYPEYE